LFARKEFDYYSALHQSNPPEPVTRGAFADSVLPVVEVGLAQFVDSDHVLKDGAERIWLEDASGHTPGQVVVRASGGGREAVFIADSVHHPLGIAEPDLVMSGDVD